MDGMAETVVRSDNIERKLSASDEVESRSIASKIELDSGHGQTSVIAIMHRMPSRSKA
jgi:hypothetical protein